MTRGSRGSTAESLGWLPVSWPRRDTEVSGPLIVTGPQRTGSTLLGRILASGNDCAFTVNGRLFSYLLQYLPQRSLRSRAEHFRVDEISWLLRRKPVLSPHPNFVEAFGRHAPALIADLRERGLDRASLIGALARGIYGQWDSGARHWGDKSNEYVLDLDDLAEAFPGALYIFTDRDPQDAARSAMDAFRGRAWQPDSLPDALSKVQSWQMLIRSFIDRHPQARHMTVRYEDMLANPRRVLRDVEEFTGIAGLAQQARIVGRSRINDVTMPAS